MGHWYNDPECPLNRNPTVQLAIGQSTSEVVPTSQPSRVIGGNPVYNTRGSSQCIPMIGHSVANVATTIETTLRPSSTDDNTQDEFIIPEQTVDDLTDLAVIESSAEPDQEREDAHPKGRRLDKNRMELDDQVNITSSSARDDVARGVPPEQCVSGEVPPVQPQSTLLKAKAKSRCGKCGQIGHNRNNPKCPLYEDTADSADPGAASRGRSSTSTVLNANEIHVVDPSLV